MICLMGCELMHKEGAQVYNVEYQFNAFYNMFNVGSAALHQTQNGGRKKEMADQNLCVSF